VVCRGEQWEKTAKLYFHYRRIPVKQTHGTQLFVYLPVTSQLHEYSGFNVIDSLFRVFTPKNDPWIKQRCVSLAKSVFNDLIISLCKPKINLLDLGCGSAKISMQLCIQGHAETQSSFDVSLIDTIPSRFSIAHSFYKNSQAFEAIRYRRNDLFDWVANMHNETAEYDITLMLRVYDTFCLYQIDSIPIESLSSVKLPDATAVFQTPTSQQIQSSPGRIVHSLHKIRTQRGYAYFQPALRDFFKAVFFCCNTHSNIEDTKENEIFLPVRSFSEDRLVMKDGRSILERIMEKSQYLIIEDSDVSLELLRHHAKKRNLCHLMFTNKRPRQYFSNSHCILISHTHR